MFGMNRSDDEKFMKAALKEAKKAYKIDEVPIGCVIVYDGKIIGKGYNRRNKDGNTLAHAELIAIDKASRKMGDWRLEGCTMYVTLEPCQMCAGAIVQARLDKVVIGTMNAKAGCCGSVINLLQMQAFNHQVEIEKGVMEDECSSMISGFFKELRAKKQKAREEAEAMQDPEEDVDGFDQVQEGSEFDPDDDFIESSIAEDDLDQNEEVFGAEPSEIQPKTEVSDDELAEDDLFLEMMAEESEER